MSTLFIASNGQLYSDPIHIIVGINELNSNGAGWIKALENKEFYECILYFVTI